jgi:hypothetical protein
MLYDTTAYIDKYTNNSPLFTLQRYSHTAVESIWSPVKYTGDGRHSDRQLQNTGNATICNAQMTVCEVNGVKCTGDGRHPNRQLPNTGNATICNAQMTVCEVNMT